ncbi:hypothetical protein METP1_03134 [Methanosarcinales archaeon]|nr:hypothetical protein METP1_03134 [Methanosarcinales archaeon]
MKWTKNVDNLLDIDWKKSPYIYILSLVFILSRLPLLNLGFGTEGDAWAIANSAFDLSYSHIYHTSRFPGYPVPEYFNSLIIDHGWLATNGLTMLLSLTSVLFFANILKNLNIENKGLLVVTYAFLPILWINSTNTMDYMWALTFIIIAWFCIIEKKFAVGGVIMGLAVGSRITSAILIIPFIYLIWIENKKIKNIIYFVLFMGIISSLLFLPLFVQYGLKFITYSSANFTLKETIIYAGYNFIELIGWLPAIFVLLIFPLSLKILLKKIIEKDKYTLFLISAIVLIFILYIKAPYESGYLIPTIPFGLLLLNKILRKKLIVIFCILLLLNSFIYFNIIEKNKELNIEFNGAIHDGMIKKDIDARTEQMSFTQKLLNANIKHSVIIIGWYLPIVSYFNKKAKSTNNLDFENDNIYKGLMPLDELQDFQKKDYSCYYINEMDNYTKRIYNFNLMDYNCMYLNVEKKLSE